MKDILVNILITTNFLNWNFGLFLKFLKVPMGASIYRITAYFVDIFIFKSFMQISMSLTKSSILTIIKPALQFLRRSNCTVSSKLLFIIILNKYD